MSFPLRWSLMAAATVVMYADPLGCGLAQYRPSAGMAATVSGDVLTLTWDGDHDSEVRLRLAIQARAPILREVAVRHKRGDDVPFSRSELSRDRIPLGHGIGRIRSTAVGISLPSHSG